MTRFVRFTRPENPDLPESVRRMPPLWVNPDQVRAIEPAAFDEPYVTIWIGNSAVRVEQDFREVLEKLEAK